MTVAHTKTLVRYLTLKQMREFAAIGLNVELNGMSLEDQAVFEAKLKSAAAKRNKSHKRDTVVPAASTFDNELV